MPFTLPRLQYAYDGLEPTIDEKTMRFHHDKHHAAYVDHLNETIEEMPSKYQDMHLVELVTDIDSIPEKFRDKVRFNAGGHMNHTLLWVTIRPKGSSNPSGPLAEAIKKAFTSLAGLKKQFEEAGEHLYGSGWVWLVVDKKGRLEIVTTRNQDNPYSYGYVPILGSDLWEHAYYLKYGPDKMKYMSAWWDVVNWDKVAEIYEAIRL